jgi:hypothetical protein
MDYILNPVWWMHGLFILVAAWFTYSIPAQCLYGLLMPA